MEKFTARNGDQVVFKAEDRVEISRPGGDHLGALKPVQALREFFQHERDEELGRWRHNGHLVAYARAEYPSYSHKGRSVMILDERDGRLIERWERDNTPDEWTDAAQAYFAAHPAPKPWHDAKPGEVWLLTFLSGEQMIGLVDQDGECFLSGVRELTVIKSTAFTAGRRIWPEVS